MRGGVRGRVFLDGGDSPTVVQASLQGETGSARADASEVAWTVELKPAAPLTVCAR